MGLFSAFKRASKRSDTSTPHLSHGKLDYMEQWNTAAPKYEVFLTGTYERKIYTYDSVPLANVKDGQTVVLEAFRGDGAMVSAHTGYRSDTAETGDTMLLYEGQPIGFTSIPREKVMQAARLGYALKMHGICRGFVEGYKGVKEMKALTPDHVYLYDWIPGAVYDRPFERTESYFQYYERDKTDYMNLLSRDIWFFNNARIEMIPTPEGSSAKPHIGVYTQDGEKISEVSARNACYYGFIEFLRKYTSFDVRATKEPDSCIEGICYSIEIVGK